VEINILIDEGFTGCPESGWFQYVVERVLIAQDVASEVELGLVITTQDRIQELNKRYRGQDRPTDVLAFYMSSEEETGTVKSPFIVPPDKVRHLGEVIISFPQATIQAQEQDHPLKRELAILTIHGVLHLLGYDHVEPEAEGLMKTREAEILAGLEDIF
jgi:probable rRNA maturation factor